MKHDIKLLSVGAPMALVEKGISEHFDVCREPHLEVRGIAVSGGHTRIDAAFVELLHHLERVRRGEDPDSHEGGGLAVEADVLVVVLGAEHDVRDLAAADERADA